MARKQLQGSPEEQAAQLYDMAVEAMDEGRYSGAVRYLQEIERAVPGFGDTPQLLAKAHHAKREQRFLLFSSLIGGMALIVLARLLDVQSELLFLAAGILGLLIGFFVGQALFPHLARRSEPATKNRS